MRWLVLSGAALLVLPALVAAAQVETPTAWGVWSSDPAETPAPLPGDFATLRFASTPANLHLELSSYATSAPPTGIQSVVEFKAEQGGPVTVRLAWSDAPHLWIDGRESTAVAYTSDSTATKWHAQIPWSAFGVTPAKDFGLRSLQVDEGWAGPQGFMPAPDHATGPDLRFTPDPSGRPVPDAVVLAAGATVEGPDYAGGASVAVDATGEPLVAYYVYDDSDGQARGIYLAHLDSGKLVPERIADTKLSRDNGGRDEQMRTQVAYDGSKAFVLYTDDPAVDHDEDGPGHPGTPDSVYVMVQGKDGWTREDPTPNGVSDVGPEDVGELVAQDGRVVAAVPVGTAVWVVERKDSEWTRVAQLEGANNAKLALGPKGVVNVAFVVYGSDGTRAGKLFYASSSDGYTPVHVGDNIDAGWEEPETDGSFAIAASPDGVVSLLWDDGRAPRDEEQKVATLKDGEWSYDIAPLVPGHGNPQYTMRLGYTAGGILVAASGYGGTDTLAMRAPQGGWTTLELPRYDVWDMAVSASGQVYFAYTEPHGGTTLAVTAYGAAHASGDGALASAGEHAAGSYGRAAPTAGLAVLAVLALAASRRR